MFALCTQAHAQGTAARLKIDSGDTAWVLGCSALVLLMTPGLALFYGGMVRSKNVLSTIMQSFIAMAVIGVQWVLWGYSLSFGPDHYGLIGDLSWFGLNHVGFSPDADYSKTIPLLAHMMFQCMFAVITPALITGAIAERMKFSTYLVFIVLWATLVYDPLAHWVWGFHGWLNTAGALDFAGGTVVHMSSGYSALVCALVMGKRKGFPSQEMRPHNLVWTLLGTGLLWFGWFGFNAGSALGANGEAALAFTTTNTATAAGVIVWLAMEWFRNGRPTALGAASGAVAGLVGITPACGFVGPMASIAIGFIAGALCFFAVGIKPRMGYDDTLDTFGVHGVGGTWGAIATGLFACAAISGMPNNGAFFGNVGQMVPQLEGVAATLVYSVVVTFVLLKVLDATMGLRVKGEEEDTGLDLTQHGEEAYLH
ncbi:MAG: ammonium transporter [Chloroflexi bacterium]|nr:ammonium transporter [Chloroflexota bacterium]